MGRSLLFNMLADDLNKSSKLQAPAVSPKTRATNREEEKKEQDGKQGKAKQKILQRWPKRLTSSDTLVAFLYHICRRKQADRVPGPSKTTRSPAHERSDTRKGQPLCLPRSDRRPRRESRGD